MLKTIKILRGLILKLTKANDDGYNRSRSFVSSNLYLDKNRITLIIINRVTWKS